VPVLVSDCMVVQTSRRGREVYREVSSEPISSYRETQAEAQRHKLCWWNFIFFLKTFSFDICPSINRNVKKTRHVNGANVVQGGTSPWNIITVGCRAMKVEVANLTTAWLRLHRGFPQQAPNSSTYQDHMQTAPQIPRDPAYRPPARIAARRRNFLFHAIV
jgi:hypothetical protein